jgi:hypothetical protein
MTAFTTVKMAVLAAIPIASAATAVEVKPGFRRKVRSANLKSLIDLPVTILSLENAFHEDHPTKVACAEGFGD